MSLLFIIPLIFGVFIALTVLVEIIRELAPIILGLFLLMVPVAIALKLIQLLFF